MPDAVFSRLVDPVDDLVFAVRLVKAKLESVLRGDLAAIGLDIGKRFVTVDVRLALAEQIEVGTVQHVDDAAHGWRPGSGECSPMAMRGALRLIVSGVTEPATSINSIRIFRSTGGNAAMAGSQRPAGRDEMGSNAGGYIRMVVKH